MRIIRQSFFCDTSCYKFILTISCRFEFVCTKFLFYSILFYCILFYSILFYPIQFNSILLYSSLVVYTISFYYSLNSVVLFYRLNLIFLQLELLPYFLLSLPFSLSLFFEQSYYSRCFYITCVCFLYRFFIFYY